MRTLLPASPCCWTDDRPETVSFLIEQPRAAFNYACATNVGMGFNEADCAEMCEAHAYCDGTVFDLVRQSTMRCMLRTLKNNHGLVTTAVRPSERTRVCTRQQEGRPCIRDWQALATARRFRYIGRSFGGRDHITGPNVSTIAILGGSISQANGISKAYSQLLGERLGVNVINRAEGGTGVARASFCFDTMLPPQGAHAAFLLIEYARNDCGLGGQGAYMYSHPAISMERLISTLRSKHPHIRPVILYIFPNGSHPCNFMYRRVAAHLQVPELRIADLAMAHKHTASMWQRTTFDRYGHPNEVGHALIATVLAIELQRLANNSLPQRLPPAPAAPPVVPLLLDPSREDPTMPSAVRDSNRGVLAPALYHVLSPSLLSSQQASVRVPERKDGSAPRAIMWAATGCCHVRAPLMASWPQRVRHRATLPFSAIRPNGAGRQLASALASHLTSRALPAS